MPLSYETLNLVKRLNLKKTSLSRLTDEIERLNLINRFDTLTFIYRLFSFDSSPLTFVRRQKIGKFAAFNAHA